MTTRPRRTPGALTGAVLAPLLLLTAACSGEEPEEERSPGDVLAAAKEQLDETSGVRLELTTEELPDGVEGVLAARGVATHAPAFDGDLTVLFNSVTVEVPVVSVDGTVHAKLPFTTSFAEIDPADYGAPDPAGLLDPATGISTWLTAAEDVEQGEETRSGRKVLTELTGTLPGSAVSQVIPSADEAAQFDATFRIDEDDLLDSARVVGPFYGDAGEVDYTIRVAEYDVDEEITAP
jgi:lipoprotein LprG